MRRFTVSCNLITIHSGTNYREALAAYLAIVKALQTGALYNAAVLKNIVWLQCDNNTIASMSL